MVRVAGELLIIPLVDYSQTPPQLINVQTINPKGIKRFITGGKVTGLCCPIGLPINEPITRLYIAEGFSTAVSVHQITGFPVLAAMNANNLTPIAKIARQLWGDIELVIAGDDDYLTERKTGTNTGKEKALSAAASSRAKTAFPPFSFEQKLAGLTDWNDYAQTQVKQAQVKQAQDKNKKEVSA